MISLILLTTNSKESISYSKKENLEIFLFNDHDYTKCFEILESLSREIAQIIDDVD